ncbi:hypothetical protein A9Z06_16630 [Rhizobium sp. YK2]|nr:hypothetical protein A9Z06_16630 [Rhizobium sp. YK2]
MRNFGSMKTALAEADAQAVRLGAVFGGCVGVTPVRRAISAGDGALVLRNVCGRVAPVRSGDRPSANENLVYFAGLALTGYSDTSCAPSANLPR